MTSIIGEIFGEGVGKVATAIGDEINKPAEIRADVEKTEIQADAQVAVAQNQVNQAEAADEDKYTSRWRPTVGYICAFGFAYQYILQPFLMYYASYVGKTFTMPSLDMSAISTVLMALAGMRSYEKVKK